MKVERFIKESFSLVGKEGHGPADEGFKWVPEIWQRCMTHISEIKHLEKLNADGKSLGMWGAMSDVEMNFDKWTDKGSYLVGIEVATNSEVPESWVKWDLPAYEYLKVLSTNENYGQTMKVILKEYMTQNDMTLIGAIQEYYSNELNEGELYLCFPIRKLV